MADKEYFALVDKDGRPIRTDYRWYNELLHAFGLGPFTYAEATGALMHCSQSREDIARIMNELERTGKMLRI